MTGGSQGPGPDLSIRPCTPDDSGSWTEFLNRNFGYRAPQSYAVDFAPLFAPHALGRSRLVFKDGSIVASASFFPVVARTPGRRFPLAIVGAVATDERFRGQGLSKKVLAELENAARDAGSKGLVLWSDKTEFYAKAGFVEIGHQEIFQLLDLPRPARLAPGTPVYGWDWSQVRQLYERHPLRVERDTEHWEALSGITSCTRVQWVDDQGRVLAYLGFDRGHDLKGIVHEWGGAPEALISLVWTVLQNRPNLFWLSNPHLSDPVSPLLGAPIHEGPLALFKPLSDQPSPAGTARSVINDSITASDLDQVWFWGLDSL